MSQVTLYKGNFQTTAFWSYLVYGSINVYLPTNLQKLFSTPPTDEYKGFADVTYNGLYRYGTRIQMSLEIVDVKIIIVRNGSQIITFHVEEKNTDIEKGILSGSYTILSFNFSEGFLALIWCLINCPHLSKLTIPPSKARENVKFS